MCCCGKPVVNGEMGYSHNGKTFGKHPPNAPDYDANETLLFDEPGRCGGVDSHAYHFRVTKQRYKRYFLLVRHGGGDERIEIHGQFPIELLENLDSNQRYWFLQSLYYTVKYKMNRVEREADAKWELAALEKRIKVRRRKSGTVVERLKRVVEV